MPDAPNNPSSTPQLCAYCGEAIVRGQGNREHFVPKCLWRRLPRGVATVPVHKSCNDAYSHDADYFRTVMATDPVAMKHPTGLDVAMGPVKSLINNHRGQFLQQAPDLAFRDHFTPAGIYVGKAWSFTIDDDRLLRILRNIVKGMFYKIYGRPLRQDRVINVQKVPGLIGEKEWLDE